MAEYIKREDAERALLERCKETGYGGLTPDDIRLVMRTPWRTHPADVRPEVRGHWYWDKDGMDWNIGAWRCSACKAMSPMWWNCDKGSPMHKSGHNFCPNCGADMREES